ncbi:MAG: N-acetyltransferase [Planctomycetota bacterium]|nr:N-acetyltransferase [Planctomycetota bacterium]
MHALDTWSGAQVDHLPGTLAVENPAGGFLALGSVTVSADVLHERRADVRFVLHPDVAGGSLAFVFLDALERQALERLGVSRAAGADADVPSVVRFTLIEDEAVARHLESRGFAFAHAEDDMACGRPEVEAAFDGELLPWREDTASDFFRAYEAAFGTRPGFPAWSERVWRAFATEYDEFAPTLSRVAVRDGRPLGFLITALAPDDATTGAHIVQVGVAPEARRRGVARALIADLARRVPADVPVFTLSVNADNPSAAALFASLGYATRQRRSVYRKVVSAS